jgi:hypothetical protein
MRWLSPDGQEWDSKFEWQVYESLHKSGQTTIRRTGKAYAAGQSDTFVYTMPVRDATCNACQSTEVSKRRQYTPDLCAPDAHHGDDRSYSHSGFYIEIKGYLRAEQRSLLRAFCKARPDIDLRFILQRDFKVGTGTAVSWITKYLKRPVTVWRGRLPDEWLRSV